MALDEMSYISYTFLVKKRQKTPPKEIKLAKERRKDWLERQKL